MPDVPALNALFHALSDDKRRAMVELLGDAALSVTEIAAPMGLRLPSAVKHLAVLEDCGLVMSEKTGRVRTYRVSPDAFADVRGWIAAREAALTRAFDRLDRAIAAFPEEPL